MAPSKRNVSPLILKCCSRAFFFWGGGAHAQVITHSNDFNVRYIGDLQHYMYRQMGLLGTVGLLGTKVGDFVARVNLNILLNLFKNKVIA